MKTQDVLISDLMFTGEIVQDADESVPWPEREVRFDRYIALLDSIDGREGSVVVRALVRSMQAKDDYGPYQTTQHVLGQFPCEQYVEALISELPVLIDRRSAWAGELLCGLANSVATEYEGDMRCSRPNCVTRHRRR